MTEYILFRPSNSLGPDFNRAAALLKQHPDIMIKDSFSNPDFAGLLIEADSKKVEFLKEQLKGWNIFPNGKIDLC